MKKILLICCLFSIFSTSCNKGCTDSTACNFGDEDEACKYSNEREELLTGAWNLVDIHDEYGVCIFSNSLDFDCEYDNVLEWVNIGFNNDNTCQLYTGPTNFSDPLPIGLWSINMCENKLNFINPTEGYSEYIYPEILPFGSQEIIELSWNIFMFEDPDGNILRWERI